MAGRAVRRVAAAAVLMFSVLAVTNTAHATPVVHPPRNPCVVAIRTVFAPHGQAVVNRFLALSFRESRHTPGIANRRAVVVRGRSWGRAAGCLQILPGVAARIGVRCSLFNAYCNASSARRLWLRMGWSPWAVR